MRTAAVICCLAVVIESAAAADEFVGPPRPGNVLRVAREIDAGQDEIDGITYCPDGRAVAAAAGFRIRFYDPATGREAREAWDIRAGTSRVRFVDATTLAHTEGANRIVRVRAYPSGKELARLELDKPLLGWDAARGTLATLSGGSPFHLRVWAAPDWKPAWAAEVLVRNQDSPRAVALSPDRAEVAVGTNHGSVHVFRSENGKLLRSVGPLATRATKPKLAYHPGGRELVVADGWGRNAAPPAEEYGLGVWDAGLTAARVEPRWGRAGELGGHYALGCLFTPDGKTLLVPCRGGTLRAYEAATGRLRHVGRLQADPDATALSPCGRLLAVLLPHPDGGHGRGVALVDWRATEAGGRKPLAPDAAWADLASADAGKGYWAVVSLGADPAGAAKLIGERLKPVAVADPAAVRKLVADLGAADFQDREAAERNLAKLGDAVATELRVAAKDESAERRARAERLLRQADRADAPDRLRASQAVEVLEYVDTPAGRAVLKVLAGGAPAAWLTADAKAALARLEALDPKP